MSPTVDKKLLPMKAHYFLFNAGTAPVVPFMPTLIRQLGFSPVIVGTIYTVLPVVGMLVKPLFGMLADKFQRQKLFFLLFQILTAVSFFLIMFIPPIPQEQKLDFHCHNGASNLKYCPPDGAFLDKCITDTLTTDNSTDLLMCELTCDADPWMWDYICQNWNVSQFCNESNKITDKSKLLFTTITPMKNIELVGQCLFFQVHRAEFGGQVVELNCPANATDFKSKCDAVCDNPQVMDVITKSKIENDEVSSLYQFWLIFILLILSWAGMAVVVSVGDAICFEMLGDKPQLYGNQRLWGAIGWGVFSLLAGFLVDRFSTGGTTKNYSVVFYMALIIISFDMIVSTRLKHSQSKFSTNIFKDVGRIFRSARVLMFFLWCILVGFGTALIWNFLFWHLENLADAQEGCNRLDWMKTLQGLAMIVQCFGGELPFFFLSGKILKKIGHIHAMSLVLLGFGIRFLCYSFLVNPWWVIPIEFTQGITFGVFYSTMASYASIVAPPGTEATLQGLVGAVFEGIGVSFGSLFGGILFNKIGGSLTFRYFGIAAICFFVIHVLVQYVMEKMFGSHGVGKTSFTHLIAHNEALTSPGWTVGCSVEVKLHEYKEGTPSQNTYFIELWDVGGSISHKNTRHTFYTPTHGIILVHDLTNKKSHENLQKWLIEILNKDGKDSYKGCDFDSIDPEQFLGSTQFRNLQIPILVIGTKSDLKDDILRNKIQAKTSVGSVAEQCGADEICLNCHEARSFAAGTTDAVKLSRFFDKVIERKYYKDTGRKYTTPYTSPITSPFVSPYASPTFVNNTYE